MKVETILVLNREEIQQIPYQLICETMSGAKFNTYIAKKKLAESFTEDEITKIISFRRQAHKWHLVSGVPDELRITPTDLELWVRLGEFCASI